MKKDLDEIKICEMYSQEMGLKEIGKILGCSQGTVTNVLKRNGVEIRGKGCSRKKLNSHNLDVSYFDKIDCENKAYWLGMLVADGTITKDGYKVSLTSKDIELIENFKEAINSEHKISKISSFDKRTNKTYTRYLIQICSKDFVKNLINLGVTSKKSYRCSFPNLEKKYYPDFLRGLFDGDGSISRKSKKNIRIKFIATKEIILEIHRFFKDKYSIESHPIYSVSDNMNVYNTHYFKDAQKVLSILYKNSNEKNRLTRKFLIYENKS